MKAKELTNDRVDSWKEIATYLNRTERTVIRWEKTRGLPIHRLPGGQAVFAYRTELDMWLQQGKAKNIARDIDEETCTEHEEGKLVPSTEPFTDLAVSSQNTRIGRRLYIWAGTCLLILAVIALVLSLRHPSERVIRPTRITKLTDDGRYKLNLKTDGRFLYFNEIEGNREVLATVSVDGGVIQQIYHPFANVDLQDLSGNGEHLLGLTYLGTEPERPLWYIPVQGGTPGRISDLTCHLARRSPNNRFVACATGTEIIVRNLETDNSRTVGPFASAVTNLEWTPDGEKIRFSLQDIRAGNFSIWEFPFTDDKRNEMFSAERLRFGDSCCSSWGWMNQGHDFVYLKPGGKGKLSLFVKPERSELISWTTPEYEVPVEIGMLETLTSANRANRLYLLIEGGARDQLLKYDTERAAFQTVLPGLSANYVTFSRDGQWMTYVDSDQKLWRSRANGREALLLSKGFDYVQLSSWSPDGRKIAFMGLRSGRPWRIFIVDRDGGEPEEAGRGDDSQGAPSWSSDGKQIVYGNVFCSETQTCWIRTIDLETGHEEKLPESHDFRTARWSPNGKYIAALAPETHHLMLFDVATRRWRMLAEDVTGDTITWSHNSKSVYADSPQGEKPIIESFQLSNKKRKTVVGLSELQKVSGRMEFWFGLDPDGSPILIHRSTASEIYSIEWSGP